MVLDHADHPSSEWIADDVRVSKVARWGDRGRVSADTLPVEPAIAEVREDDETIEHRVRAAPVLVHSRPRVEAVGRDVDGGALGVDRHDDGPAALVGPTLNPVEPIVVEPRFAKRPAARNRDLDAQRRSPRAVRDTLIRALGFVRSGVRRRSEIAGAVARHGVAHFGLTLKSPVDSPLAKCRTTVASLGTR